MLCALFCNVLKINGVAGTFCARRKCIRDVLGTRRKIAQGAKRTNPGGRGAPRRREPEARTIRTGDERTFGRIAQVPINVKCGTSIRNDILAGEVASGYWRVATCLQSANRGTRPPSLRRAGVPRETGRRQVCLPCLEGWSDYRTFDFWMDSRCPVVRPIRS
jgi:hypothetical protein